jgi:serine/threonine protein phosphatase PrpC
MVKQPEQQPVQQVVHRPVQQPVRPAPAWVGGFAPYSVGEPGAAALKVKPRPDPTEWDRRDTVLDGVYLHDDLDRRVLQLRAASVRGLSHRYNGTVRQDDYAFRCTEDRRHLVVVVSDGVSNSKLSHKAAAVVSRLGAELVALELARRSPARIEWAEIVTQLSDEIVRLGHKLVEPAPDGGELSVGEVAHLLAATALFGVIELRPVEPEVDAYFYAVGDSSAWVLRDGHVWQPMFEVKNGGEGAASSVTKALPLSRPPAPRGVTTTVKKGDVVVLMSDGIGDPLEDGSRTVGRFLAEAWREPPAPLQFAAQVDFARKTHDDDRTAVAVWAV